MCRTFSFPEIKRADLYAAAVKATNVLEAANASDTQWPNGDCNGGGMWTDDDLMDFLDNFPDELDVDFSSGGSTDDSSFDHQSLSDDSTSHDISTGPSFQPMLLVPMAVNLPTYHFVSNHGLYSLADGFIGLPCPKSFSFLPLKTPALIREEKLSVLDPFIGALNEGDLFSLYSICQTLCAPNILFNSTSCGFNYSGSLSVMIFWTLLFEEHYQGRIQCLSRRLNSTLRPMPRGVFESDTSMFESVDFVLKLEGCRLSEFRSFELFQTLMNSGCIHDNLSFPEVINISEAFYKQNPNNMTHSHQIFHMVYLFEVNLKFHALNHTISQWNFELMAVQCNN
jgi:hypothetical protein